MIPFPIRTLDFGIKGGTTLNEMPINIVLKNNFLQYRQMCKCTQLNEKKFERG
jgi:hypothetical protein